jgi:large subunit ribosomal protein L25
MAGERVRLEVKEREACGTRVSRRLRRDGFVPGVLYGGEGKARAFFVEERVLRGALGGDHGVHAILDVVLEGQQKAHHAVLKDYQLDPRRSSLLHVDLHEVRLDRPIQAQVAVELIGEPAGANFGGVLTQIVREVTVEALPTAIPDRLELDISALEIGDQVRVSDIVIPDGVTLLDDPDAVAATVAAPRVEVIEEEVPEEIEGEEPAEPGAEVEAAGDEQASADTGES